MVSILFYCIDIVDGEGGTVADNVVKYFKPVSVIPVQPIVGAEPQKAIVILANAENRIVRQPLLYAKIPHRRVFGQDYMAATNKKKKKKRAAC
jgi:hypothetical protein